MRAMVRRLAASLAIAGIAVLCLASPAAAADAAAQAASRPTLRGDADGDRRLTLDEYLAEAGRRFERFDRDRSGGVERAEVEALAAEIAAGIRARMLGRFEREDADGDGRVERAEADRFASGRFSTLDQDADGLLAAADLRRRPARPRAARPD